MDENPYKSPRETPGHKPVQPPKKRNIHPALLTVFWAMLGIYLTATAMAVIAEEGEFFKDFFSWQGTLRSVWF